MKKKKLFSNNLDDIRNLCKYLFLSSSQTELLRFFVYVVIKYPQNLPDLTSYSSKQGDIFPGENSRTE